MSLNLIFETLELAPIDERANSLRVRSKVTYNDQIDIRSENIQRAFNKYYGTNVKFRFTPGPSWPAMARRFAGESMLSSA